MDAGQLHDAIHAVCPIVGVSIGKEADKSTWRFMPTDGVTDQQKADAQAVIDGWDGSDATDKKRAAKESMTHTSPLIRLMRSSDRVTYKSVVQMRKAFNDLLDILSQGRFPTAQEKASLKLPIMTWAQAKQVVKSEIDNDDPAN